MSKISYDEMSRRIYDKVYSASNYPGIPYDNRYIEPTETDVAEYIKQHPDQRFSYDEVIAIIAKIRQDSVKEYEKRLAEFEAECDRLSEQYQKDFSAFLKFNYELSPDHPIVRILNSIAYEKRGPESEKFADFVSMLNDFMPLIYKYDLVEKDKA